ncbi:MAG: hypothetical protein JSW73_00275 [Candidatus Woesearchaeota archaeon]|nr:MAG: hypothetical protein JSW73_00275 [Candidatus Woesearchaeota archaeon]
MGKGKLKKLGLGILGLILIIIGVGWYLWESFPKIGNLTNLQSLGIIIQGAIGLVVIIVGIVVILLAKD